MGIGSIRMQAVRAEAESGWCTDSGQFAGKGYLFTYFYNNIILLNKAPTKSRVNSEGDCLLTG